MTSYKARTIDSPSRLKRFSHRKRFQIAVELMGPLASNHILDYGTGDGYFLRQLALANPEAHVIGFEPDWNRCQEISQCSENHSHVRIVPTLTEFSPGSFHKISCLEVMEHLFEEDLGKALADIRSLLSNNGSVVVSVPVEIGAASIVKYAVRKTQGHLEPGMTIWTTAKSSIGLATRRHREPTSYGHQGFDYRKLEARFKVTGFHIETKLFSPVPALKGVLNSQVFYILRKNDNSVQPSR